MMFSDVVFLPSKIIKINTFQNQSTMKKVLTLTLLAVILFGACEKEENSTATHEQSRNRVIALPNDGKTGNSTYLFALGVGHSGKDCKGCMMLDGHLVHINCIGAGDDCWRTAAVQLQQERFVRVRYGHADLLYALQCLGPEGSPTDERSDDQNGDDGNGDDGRFSLLGHTTH